MRSNRAIRQWRLGRFYLAAAALFGMTAVILGAFGAHLLEPRWRLLGDGLQRLEWWQLASEYQLAHAIALGLLALLAPYARLKWLALCGGAMCCGIAVFSGSLYALALTGYRQLGAITPLGGTALILGWLLLLVMAVAGPPEDASKEATASVSQY